jgi:UDP-glucose:tetrahydrobiopterin glucosyltransferase
MKVLLVSSPIGALGTGQAGGVESTVATVARVLQDRGHAVEVLAPRGSSLPGTPLTAVEGALQVSALHERRRGTVSMAYDGLLARMWDTARARQRDFDRVVNFGYDWLPFYLGPFFATPVRQWVTMGALDNGMREVIAAYARGTHNGVATYTRTQAETFGVADDCRVLGYGLDTSLYQLGTAAEPVVAWVARISREKGLEDALGAAQLSHRTLRVFGHMDDAAYWKEAQARFPGAHVEYGGFLPTAQLQRELGRCAAFLATPKWVEALGISLLEALACGVPVVSYARGAPTEFVREGETGFLVKPDDVEALAAALAKVDGLSRPGCRASVEREFSLGPFGERVEAWLDA